MKVKPRVGSYAVYEPPEEGWQNWQAQLGAIHGELEAQGSEIIAAPEAVKDLASAQRMQRFFAEQEVDMLHALVASWSFDHYTVMIQQQTQVPVAVRAVPGIRSGSIVGAQQLGCTLTDIEAPHALFYGPPDNAQAAAETAVYARACMLKRRLRGATIAVVGRRTEGMTPTAVDELEMLRLFGVRLEHYGLEEIEKLAARESEEEARQTWQRFSAGAAVVLSKTEHGMRTARNYLTLKRLAAERGWSGLSIGSYPACQGTMCAPIAWLNEEGLPTACEGDVNSALCMLILSMLSDEPVHFGEMLEFDETANSLVTSHCGCGSPSLASKEGYSLQPVRLANDGVCIRYTAKPGPITYANLVGRKGNYRLCGLQGEAVPTQMVFEGNPLRFVLQSDLRQVRRIVSDHGFGHHWMAVYSHIAPELQAFCKVLNIKGVFPDNPDQS